ncbi:hypothetical protein Maes01_01149 [Microbulbifer aestuariivivens]|uniref:Uncharacterized protein n=1 Tax=Microbulbifer aestuariivivens TaxID=1908308 RepID=A0ABP9WN23_9GAMM
MAQNEYQALQQIIQSTVAAEQHHGLLHTYLRKRLPALHHTVSLPPGDGVLILASFAIRYLEALPRWLEEMVDHCHTAGISTRTMRRLVRRAFCRAQRSADSRGGTLSLSALLPYAYLCHRLLEEANDRLQFACGIPLLPRDPMVANLVMRELIGEEIAATLDRACLRAARDFDDLQLASERVVALILGRQCHSTTPGCWPDFAAEMRIGLLVPEIELETEKLH